VEAAQSAGKISAARWQLYARQAPGLLFQVRPAVQRGRMLPLSISSANRAGSNYENLFAEYQTFTITAGHASTTQPYGIYIPIGSGVATTKSGGFTMRVSSVSAGTMLDSKFEEGLPDGPNVIHLSLPGVVGQGMPLKGPILATVNAQATVTVNILPATQAAVALHHDPSLQAAVERAISVSPVMHQYTAKPGGTTSLEIWLLANAPPIDLSYDVFARSGDRQWEIGHLYYAQSDGPHNTQFQLGADAPEFGQHPDPLDIVFRPDPDYAAKWTDITEIWDGEVVIKNVEIYWQGKPKK
jgi:hypothetical protein